MIDGYFLHLDFNANPSCTHPDNHAPRSPAIRLLKSILPLFISHHLQSGLKTRECKFWRTCSCECSLLASWTNADCWLWKLWIMARISKERKEVCSLLFSFCVQVGFTANITHSKSLNVYWLCLLNNNLNHRDIALTTTAVTSGRKLPLDSFCLHFQPLL